ncbi:YicC/YloC family endoribonuclease [Otoolea muris]|uniref:YicC/YloC family endoribonuclease n=1 Tax=Otoolea muris TaxID=2941515 RepID=UPI00203D2BAA|nr:YicC/YloC family endoribonuclease [Otoolea muris]
MVKSMTGFGRHELSTEEYRISAEMKAVNHRYLDLSVKMPRRFNSFESGIRALLKDYVQRGKVDLFIAYEDYTQSRMSLKYNASLAAEYMGYFRAMAEQFSIPDDVSVTSLARFPEIFSMEQEPEDEEQIWHILEEAVSGAASRFVESRIREGESLKKDLLGKLDAMEGMLDELERRSPAVVSEYREKLAAKVQELLGSSSIDESRIVTEATIFADKICTDEETVRLRSHIEATRAELSAGGSVGRKLDFIAQEMNREANTILSKANDLEISDCAISLKTEIEKIREQIQNIE